MAKAARPRNLRTGRHNNVQKNAMRKVKRKVTQGGERKGKVLTEQFQRPVDPGTRSTIEPASHNNAGTTLTIPRTIYSTAQDMIIFL